MAIIYCARLTFIQLIPPYRTRIAGAPDRCRIGIEGQSGAQTRRAPWRRHAASHTRARQPNTFQRSTGCRMAAPISRCPIGSKGGPSGPPFLLSGAMTFYCLPRPVTLNARFCCENHFTKLFLRKVYTTSRFCRPTLIDSARCSLGFSAGQKNAARFRCKATALG
jgi:hypothetical protein